MDYRSKLLVEEPVSETDKREVFLDARDPTPVSVLYARHARKPTGPRPSMRDALLASLLQPVAESAALAMQEYQTPAGFFDLEYRSNGIKSWIDVFSKHIVLHNPTKDMTKKADEK